MSTYIKIITMRNSECNDENKTIGIAVVQQKSCLQKNSQSHSLYRRERAEGNNIPV